MSLFVSKVLLLIYFALKPYYIFSSGGIQLADIFLVLSFINLCFTALIDSSSRNKLTKSIRENRNYIYFVSLVAIINSLYSFIFPDVKFMMSTLFILFTLFAIINFTTLMDDREFMNRIGILLKLNLVLQLILYVLNLGRLYSVGRYMGTFNDPNQFAYYVFVSFLFIVSIDYYVNRRKPYMTFLLALLLIALSGSTGALLGISTFVVASLAFIIFKPMKTMRVVNKNSLLKNMLIVTMTTGLLVLAFSAEITQGSNLLSPEATLTTRVGEKVSKVQGESEVSFVEDRGLSTIVNYPQYLLFGAGEGALERFFDVGETVTEIHSTPLSLMFYYGLIPVSILIVWTIKTLRGVRSSSAIILVSLFIVSAILLIQRQALFWMLIPLIGFYGKQRVAEPRKYST